MSLYHHQGNCIVFGGDQEKMGAFEEMLREKFAISTQKPIVDTVQTCHC